MDSLSGGSLPRVASGAFLYHPSRLLGDDRGAKIVDSHELLHCAESSVLVAEGPGGGLLELEAQVVLSSPCLVVNLGAHEQQEVQALAQNPVFLVRDEPPVEHLLETSRLVVGLRYPHGRLEFAKPSLALLHVRFEQVEGLPVLFRLPLPLLDLSLDEIARYLGKHLAVYLPFELGVKTLVAADEPAVEKRAQYGRVASVHGELGALPDASHAVSDVQPEVPEQVEKPLYHLLGQVLGTVGVEKKKVYVGVGAKLPPAVAPEGDHRDSGEPGVAVLGERSPYEFVHDVGAPARQLKAYESLVLPSPGVVLLAQSLVGLEEKIHETLFGGFVGWRNI